MFRFVLFAALALALAAPTAQAQGTPTEALEIPESMRARKLPRQDLSGPRFGFTTFTGDLARRRSDAGPNFGWDRDKNEIGTAMIIAGGATIPAGNLVLGSPRSRGGWWVSEGCLRGLLSYH